MGPSFRKVVALVLLLIQGMIGATSGQFLCIPIRDCGTHERSGHAASGHCVSDGCNVEQVEESCKDHEHDAFSSAIHRDDECGCHLHVPLPDSEQLPSNPRGDNAELRSVLVPVLIALVVTWDFDPAVVIVERFKPPDFSVSDQVLGLRATRLLI